MSTGALSHHASGNQANHASNQVNGNIGDHLEIREAIFNNYKMPSLQELPPVMSSFQDEFNFGPIPALEEDDTGEDESEPMQRLAPTIHEADVDCINVLSSKIRQQYKLLRDHTARVKATCVKQLRQTAKDQRMRIDIHVRCINQWSKLPLEHQSDDESILGEVIDTNVGMNQRPEDLKRKLQNIHGMLEKAVVSAIKVGKVTQNGQSASRIRGSSVFKEVSKVFEQIDMDIAAIESQFYQNSSHPWPFESTKGFARLYVSGSTTRTLYRHLCEACPLKGQEQGHGHTALVGLVPMPEKDPICISPNEVAVTSHHVAIESTFDKGNYIWFEARSRLLLPGDEDTAVCSQISSPLLIVMDGLRQRLRRDSGYSSTSTYPPESRIQISGTRPDLGEVCRVQVCPGSLAQGSECLAMCISVDQENGHQIFYLDEKKRPKTSCKPLNLAKIIQQGERTTRQRDRALLQRSLALRGNRFKIALKIAEATLRYGWREWLGDAWGIRDIEFYPIESERMPFLRAEMFNHGCGGLGKFMFNLGFVLLELGLWKQLQFRTTGFSYNKELDKELNSLGNQTGAPYQEAVRYCVRYNEIGNSDLNDNHIFERTFYQKVISPLREMVKRTESVGTGMPG